MVPSNEIIGSLAKFGVNGFTSKQSVPLTIIFFRELKGVESLLVVMLMPIRKEVNSYMFLLIRIQDIQHTSGIKKCFSPSSKPSRVTPRKKKMTRTKYGNVAVTYTT